MNKKLRKLVTLSQEVIDDIERKSKVDDFNFSAWVERIYIEAHMSEKGARLKQKRYEKLAKKARNFADSLKRNRENLLKTLTEEQQIELKQARAAIKRNPKHLDGRLRLWNNTFKTKLSKPEFIELLGDI